MKAGFREFNWYYAEEKCLAQEQNEVLTELKAASHRPLEDKYSSTESMRSAIIRRLVQSQS